MKAFRVKICEHYYVHETIEADTAQEAIEKAEAMYDSGSVNVDFFGGYDVEVEIEMPLVKEVDAHEENTNAL